MFAKRKAKALEIHVHFCGFSQHYFFFSFHLGCNLMIPRTQVFQILQTMFSGAVLLSGLWLLSWVTLPTTWNVHQPL